MAAWQRVTELGAGVTGLGPALPRAHRQEGDAVWRHCGWNPTRIPFSLQAATPQSDFWALPLATLGPGQRAHSSSASRLSRPDRLTAVLSAGQRWAPSTSCSLSSWESVGYGWLSWVSPGYEQAIDTGRDTKDRCHPGHTAAWGCFVPAVVGSGQMGCIRRLDDTGGRALGTRILRSGPPSEGALARRSLLSPPSC